MTSADEMLMPTAWHALPEKLRKPFWTVRQTTEATGLSRSLLNRLWADPRSTFPKPRRVGGRVHIVAVDVLRHMEG